MATLTTAAPTLAQPRTRGVGDFFSETYVLYSRSIKKLIRRPVLLYFSLVQPLIWLLLFGQIFNRIAQFPGAVHAFGGKSYFQFIIPAVVLQTILFGAGQSGIGLLADMDSGFLDKLLTTPINRTAILMGKILGDLTRMIVQGIILIAIAWVFGQFQSSKVAYSSGILGILATLGIALLFGIGLAGFNTFVALRTRNTEATFLISNFLTLPLLFTSSAQLPLQLLPDWLQNVARFNPCTYAIDSMRLFLNGSQSVSESDPTQLVLETVGLLLVIAVVTLALAVSSFRMRTR